jgi:hypothetical protein
MEKEKHSQPVPGLEPPIIQPLAQRCTTELSRFFLGTGTIFKCSGPDVRSQNCSPSMSVFINWRRYKMNKIYNKISLGPDPRYIATRAMKLSISSM